MKNNIQMRKFLFIGFLLALSVNPLFSQTEKGKVLVVLNSTILNNGLSQIGYQTQKTKDDDFEGNPTKTFNLNLTPKMGLFAWDNLALGVEGSINFISIKTVSFLVIMSMPQFCLADLFFDTTMGRSK